MNVARRHSDDVGPAETAALARGAIAHGPDGSSRAAADGMASTCGQRGHLLMHRLPPQLKRRTAGSSPAYRAGDDEPDTSASAFRAGGRHASCRRMAGRISPEGGYCMTAMNPKTVIRDETDADADVIGEVTEAAFRDLVLSDHTEQLIVAALRAARALTVSLVAERDGQVVGHIAFSPVAASKGATGWYGLGAATTSAPGHRHRTDRGGTGAASRDGSRGLLPGRASRLLPTLRIPEHPRVRGRGGTGGGLLRTALRQTHPTRPGHLPRGLRDRALKFGRRDPFVENAA